MFYYNKYKYHLLLLNVIVGLFVCCTKKVKYEDATYKSETKARIKFLSTTANPSVASVGDTINFTVTGLLNDTSQVTIYLNQIKANVVSIQDSLLTIVVPDNVTSGPLEIALSDGEYYIGPIVSIVGSVSVSTAFDVGNGTDGPINQILVASDKSYILVGSFSSYNGHPSSTIEAADNITDINSTNASFISTFNQKMKGSDGAINSICYTSSGYYMIGGLFTGYSDLTSSIISNITRLNSNGSLDTSTVNKISTNTSEDYFVDTVPTFNVAFTGGSITKIFKDPTQDSMLIVIGSFTTYNQYDYQNSTESANAYYTVPVKQLARIYPDGSLDSTFNYTPGKGKSNTGLNGNINDAIQLSDNSIVMVGAFTTFNSTTVNRITKLNTDGTPDLTFNNGGSGANKTINRITYNSNTNKILIVGDFTQYNGVACNGVAMLNANGSLDTTFILQDIGSHYVNYAGQLNNGLIIVSGTFEKYQGYIRQGFMILNPNGTLATRALNTTGAFVGKINGFIESTTQLGLPAVTIYGDFSIFDNQKFGNIVRFEFDE